MSEPNDRQDDRITNDELTLYAFGELPPERMIAVEQHVRQDDRARATVEAMQRLATLGSDDDARPADELLATTRATTEIAAKRRVRSRRVKQLAAVGSMAAAAAIVLVVARLPDRPTHKPTIDKPSGRITGRGATVGLNQADRQALRQTYARILHQRDWDDPLERQTTRLRRRLAAARVSSSRIWPASRLAAPLHPDVTTPATKPHAPARTTQPDGSTCRPVQNKETSHA